MADYCPTLSADPAVLFASGGYNVFMDLAPRAYEEAVRQANSLNNYIIRPVDFTASFDFEGQLTPFQRPQRPVIDLSQFMFHADTSVPNAPGFLPNSPTITPIPEADLTAPAIAFSARPDTPIVVAPEAPPRPTALVVPTLPDYTLPPTPTLIELNLPAVPNIVIPAFDSPRPTFIDPELSNTFNFTPEAYTSALFDSTKDRIQRWIDGEGVLPAAIEQALFGRGRSRIEVETRREIDASIDQWGNRGFTEPGGVLNARIIELRQNAQDKKAELNRDLTIRMAELALDNMRFAITQSLAAEQLASSIHLEEQRILLAAVTFQRDTAIAIVNVKVAIFNARMQAYQTDATVFAERIRGALAQVEVYRAQIEGEKAKGEINEQRVRVYVEQVRTLNAMADFYRAQVEGVKAQADVQRSVIESFKAEVEAYGARWDAFGKEVEAYKAMVEAENVKSGVHRNLVDAHVARVSAWSTQNNLNFDKERLRIAGHSQSLLAWRGLLDRMLGLVQAENGRIAAVAQGADAQARIYTADAAVESAASAASDRSFQLGLEKEVQEVQAALKQAEINIQQNIQLTQIQVEVRKTLSQVMSQLASAAMSAMNFSASVSSSRGESKSCSTSVSWSGEAPDLS